MPWNLPSKIEIGYVPNRGVLSSLNDCIYRNMNDFRYIMTIDIDEFIIPHMHDQIPEMLEYLISGKVNFEEFQGSMYLPKHLMWPQNNLNDKDNSIPSTELTSFNFQNSFFYLGFGKFSFRITLNLSVT